MAVCETRLKIVRLDHVMWAILLPLLSVFSSWRRRTLARRGLAASERQESRPFAAMCTPGRYSTAGSSLFGVHVRCRPSKLPPEDSAHSKRMDTSAACPGISTDIWRPCLSISIWRLDAPLWNPTDAAILDDLPVFDHSVKRNGLARCRNSLLSSRLLICSKCCQKQTDLRVEENCSVRYPDASGPGAGFPRWLGPVRANLVPVGRTSGRRASEETELLVK